jgi:glycerol kinase
MSEPAYVVALDQGTTSSRTIVFDHEQRAIGAAQREFTQFFPQEGWVEHDPREIWATQYGTMTEAIAGANIDPARIAAIGITNQRETTVVWDRATGEPIYNAIVWQCRRTAPIVDELVARPGMAEHIRATTGLLPDAYFSATKIRWILDHVPGAQLRAERGELAFGTIDSWLVWKLTNGAAHITDVTNASRTMLFDIHRLAWDETILRALDIPRALLPDVRSNSEIYGYANIMGKRIPVAGMAGDQQAALFGQGCFAAGDAKCTYGTGCFLLMNTGEEVIQSNNNLLSTVACQVGGRTTYALEGSVFVGGSVVQWLRDGLGLIASSAEVGTRAARVPDTGGVYLVPAFTGLGAPWWDMYARGTIVGITRGKTADHLVRAADDAFAFLVADLVGAMENDTHAALTALRVDGGATRDAFLMQFQADILGRQVLRPTILETTALGAAYLAGLATGVWDDIEEISRLWSLGKRFDATMELADAARLVEGWHRAVERSRGWALPNESAKTL